MKEQDYKQLESCIQFLNHATTPYHVAQVCEEELKKADFQELFMEQSWEIQAKGKYFIRPYPSMLLAFTMPSDATSIKRLKIIASHLDTPGFKIKPMPEIKAESYMKLNTEVYGGPILNTWMDRLLSFGGIVSLQSNDIFKPRLELVDFKKPMMTIPNLAIHMNHKINEGIELNKQKDLLPVVATMNEVLEKDGYLVKLLAEKLNVETSEILDFDLHVYLAEEAKIIGGDDSMLSSPRLDDLSMVYASVQSIIASENKEDIHMMICYDHEEIGSMTLQGADSNVLPIIMDRITDSIKMTETNYHKMLSSSFMISADGAHALHPNQPEKNDLTNKPVLNKGMTVKLSAQKSYASDSESVAVFQQLADRAGVKVQKYVNRSDVRGGKTLGPIMVRHLPIKTVDVGIAMLAMHSSRELIGVYDLLDSIQIFKTFYTI